MKHLGDGVFRASDMLPIYLFLRTLKWLVGVMDPIVLFQVLEIIFVDLNQEKVIPIRFLLVDLLILLHD